MYNELKLPVDQQFLLPCDMMEWLPEDSLAYTIFHIVSTMDLGEFYGKYRKDGIGGKFLDPAIKLSIFYYAYCTGVFSSRKIEEKIHYDIGFRVLARNQSIDHTTLARFRQEFKEPIAENFKYVLKILEDAGAIKAGEIALDGTKIKANASMEKNKGYNSIRKEIDLILQESQRIDEEEDKLYGKDNGYEELPGLPKNKVERFELLNKIKEEIEAEQKEKATEQEEKIKARDEDEKVNGKRRGRKPKPPQYEPGGKEKRNTTDPESRIMKSRNGLIQGYNGQVVASENQYIVAHDVVNDQNDRYQLEPMLFKAIENLRHINENKDILPKRILADAGYWAYESLLSLGSTGVEILVSPRNEHKFSEVYEYSRIILDMDDFCRSTNPAPCRALIQHVATWVLNTYCKLDEEVTGSKEILKQVMGKKVAESSRHIYSRRKVEVEPVFAQIKTNMGFEKFSMRGKKNCEAEWAIVCTAYNIKKGWMNGMFSNLSQTVRSILENSTQKASVC